MSLGCAVIGANSPGIRNIIQNGVNGILCQTDSEIMIKNIIFIGKPTNKTFNWVKSKRVCNQKIFTEKNSKN